MRPSYQYVEAGWLRRRARRPSRSAVVTAIVNRVEAALRRIAADLDLLHAEWALVA
ncbi:MAG: hypothetical protein ACRDTH_10575 [Pseudonocardiaceae bacterium]